MEDRLVVSGEMEPILAQLEQSGLATWIRESGVLYGYPLILFLHTLSVATFALMARTANSRDGRPRSSCTIKREGMYA